LTDNTGSKVKVVEGMINVRAGVTR
jgi:hypothetical protein